MSRILDRYLKTFENIKNNLTINHSIRYTSGSISLIIEFPFGAVTGRSRNMSTTFFATLLAISFGSSFVKSYNFYQCSDNDYRMVCDWSSDVLYSGCVAPSIREVVFQFFDASSAVDLSCSNSVRRIFIAECDDVCTNLERILRSSHVVQVFCGDLKCVCISLLYLCILFIVWYSTCFHFVTVISLGVYPSLPTSFSPKITTTTRESPAQDVKVSVEGASN